MSLVLEMVCWNRSVMMLKFNMPICYLNFNLPKFELKIKKKAYTDIYVNTQQLMLNTTLFYTWRHVSAAHTAIFRPAYNRTGPFECAKYGIPDCLHITYM